MAVCDRCSGPMLPEDVATQAELSRLNEENQALRAEMEQQRVAWIKTAIDTDSNFFMVMARRAEDALAGK